MTMWKNQKSPGAVRLETQPTVPWATPPTVPMAPTIFLTLGSPTICMQNTRTKIRPDPATHPVSPVGCQAIWENNTGFPEK